MAEAARRRDTLLAEWRAPMAPTAAVRDAA